MSLQTSDTGDNSSLCPRAHNSADSEQSQMIRMQRTMFKEDEHVHEILLQSIKNCHSGSYSLYEISATDQQTSFLVTPKNCLQTLWLSTCCAIDEIFRNIFNDGMKQRSSIVNTVTLNIFNSY